jgi:hypothetical protein
LGVPTLSLPALEGTVVIDGLRLTDVGPGTIDTL